MSEPERSAEAEGDNTMKGFYTSEIRLRSFLSLFFLVLIPLLFSSPAFGDHNNGGSTQPPAPGPLPPASVQPLPSDAPAPWGIDPATLPGVKVQDTIKGNGFLQETITLQNGNSFFFQDINTADFSSQSYVKNTTGSSNDPEGNLIFNQVIKDPAWGLTDHTKINGFKQPIQLHFDIVESKVAQLTSGFNQMDMHFRQLPFLDTATGKIRNRQDIGVWITGFAGVLRAEITTDHRFVPTESTMSHVIARSIGSFTSGGGGSGSDDGVRRGSIDWWNDLEVVKITDAATNQIVTFSKCNDFTDPGGRDNFEFINDRGSRGGCSGGTGQPQRQSLSNTFRPPIPGHDSDGFQLTPLNWDRWGGGGSMSLGSGGQDGRGGLTTFPSTERFRNDD